MGGIKVDTETGTYSGGTRPSTTKGMSNESVYRMFLEKLSQDGRIARGPGKTTVTVQPWGRIELIHEDCEDCVVNLIAPLELWFAKKQLFQNREFMGVIRKYVEGTGNLRSLVA